MALPFNQPFNQVKLSSIEGVVLDCVVATGLKIGGGSPTDNTALINNFLAQWNLSVPLEIIWDGATACTGIILPQGIFIKLTGTGWGSGIFMLQGSNSHAIYNNGKTVPFDQLMPAPAQLGTVMISNFFINGNRGNGTTGNSTTGDPRGQTSYWYTNIDLANTAAVIIEDMQVWDSPAYSIRLNNCSNIQIKGNIIYNPNTTTTFNQDCVHIDGPATNVQIIGNVLGNNGSDDGVAINAPEGYGGTIDRVIISNNIYQNTLTGARIYGGAVGQVTDVIFSSNLGVVSSYVLLLGVSVNYVSGELIRSVVANDNTFNILTNAKGFVNFEGAGGGFGDLTLTDCTWLSPAQGGYFIQCDYADLVSSITVNNCRIYRTTSGNATGHNLLRASASLTVAKFTINGFYVVNQQGQAYAAIPAALAMTNITITQLVLADLDMTNTTLLADSYTNIGSIIGPGLGSQASSKSAAYTLLPTDGTIFANSTTAPFALTLPAKLYNGHEIKVVKTDASANAVTLTGTISGVANPTLAAQYSKARFYTDGTNWYNS